MSPDDVVITFVHGTWSDQQVRGVPRGEPAPIAGSWAAVGEALVAAVPRAQIWMFRWSGANSFRARNTAAEHLAEHLTRRLAQSPEGRHYVISHSHGGNVTLSALQDRQLASRFAGVFFLSTPFLTITRRPDAPYLHMALGAGLISAVAVGLVYENPYVGAPAALVALVAMLGAVSPESGVVRFIDRHAQSSLHTPDVWVVRTHADEASSALLFVQVATWVTRRMWALFAGAGHGPTLDRMLRLAHSPVIPGLLVVASALFIGALFFESTLGPVLLWAVLLVFMLPSVLAFAAACALCVSIMAAIPAFCAVVVLSWAFGLDVGRLALSVDMAVETTPPGLSMVYQFPPDMHRGWRHSSYEDARVIAFIADTLNRAGSRAQDRPRTKERAS